MKLRKIEAGLYETTDGAYRVERCDSTGEWDNAQVAWELTRRPTTGDPEYVEWPLVEEYNTKRECVEHLETLIVK